MIDSIDSKQRKDKILEVLQAVSSAGVIVKFLVCDGFAGNIAMGQLLVGQLNPLASDFQTFFINPENGEKVYIYLDPCHMIKLVRNIFGNRIILDRNGNKIEWRYIECMYKFSQKNDFHVHKLTKRHMDWNRNKMCVALATQTLSESNAKAIEVLMNSDHPDFAGAYSTVDFLKRCNTLFDIFNSKSIHHNNIYK